jgi:uncharacterized membrane protein
MGTSMAVVAKNLAVMLTWGAIVLGLFLLSLVTGLLGLIIVFPVLGHGTWHAYRTMAPAAERERQRLTEDALQTTPPNADQSTGQ